MITIHRAQERGYQLNEQREAWLTFGTQDRTAAPPAGFGSLQALVEGLLPPRAGFQEPRENVEVITYVREGSLAYDDSLGQTGTLSAGEFQRMTVGPGVHYSDANASTHDWAHVFQIWLRNSKEGLEPGLERRRFSTADRRGALRVVASPEGIHGSLRVHQDAYLYSAILSPGQHVVHSLGPGRAAWLHIVAGGGRLDEIALAVGDGAGITGEARVAFSVDEETELLLLDLAGISVNPPVNGVS